MCIRLKGQVFNPTANKRDGNAHLNDKTEKANGLGRKLFRFFSRPFSGSLLDRDKGDNFGIPKDLSQVRSLTQYAILPYIFERDKINGASKGGNLDFSSKPGQKSMPNHYDGGGCGGGGRIRSFLPE